MSLKYRDVTGKETPIAGLNGLSGELVPSVSYYQTGVATITETIPAYSYKAVDVTLSEMPDKDYCVVFSQHTRANTHADAWGQTAEGFRVYMYNDTNEDMVPSDARTIAVTWRAFKLMTDESRAIDEQAIATNTADIATINDNGVLKIQRNGEVSDCNAAIPPKAGMAMWWGTSTTTANIPANGYGSIVAFRTGTTVKQYWFRNGTVMEYSRSIECDNDGNYASTNSDWEKIMSQSDITPITDVIPSTASASNQVATASDITRIRRIPTASVGDMNNLVTPGLYAFSNTSLNTPYAGYGVVEVYGLRPDTPSNSLQWIYQEVTYGNGERYLRSSYNANSTTPTNWSDWQKMVRQSDLTSTVTSGSTAPITSQGVANYINTGVANTTNTNTFTFDLPTLANGDAWEITVSAQTWNGASGFVTKYIASRSGTSYRLSNCGGVTTGHSATISENTVAFVWNNSDNTIAYWRARYVKLI